MRRVALGLVLAALIAVPACGPDEDKDAGATPSDPPASTRAARPGEIRDQRAHISYVLPQGWYAKPPDTTVGLYSSVASTVDPNAPTPAPAPDPAKPLATLMVGIVDAKAYAAKQRSMPEVAETVGRAQLELIYPAKAQDTVRSSEATRVDGRNGWLMDIESTPEDPKVPPFRLRVTVVDTGTVPIYLLTSAPSAATERFAQIEAIERSVRF